MKEVEIKYCLWFLFIKRVISCPGTCAVHFFCHPTCVGAHNPPPTGSWPPLCHPIKTILESPLPGVVPAALASCCFNGESAGRIIPSLGSTHKKGLIACRKITSTSGKASDLRSLFVTFFVTFQLNLQLINLHSRNYDKW